jgi:iron complex outermembrane receptor protein
VVVTGTYEPLPLEEVDRSVSTLPVRGFELLSRSLSDFLRMDPSLDLRSRAPNGLQGDLSIRGGTFGQTLVLIDGQRVNDVQSGHHNLDIPIPVEMVSRIEVLKGAGSTLYGSDAIGGVVNIVTQAPEAFEARVRTAIGNHGTNQERATIGFRAGPVWQQLAASRDFSSGFMPNRDYRDLALSSRTSFGGTTVLLAHDDRPFGAEQFYGNYNSWERTKTWFGSVRQQVNARTDAFFALRRHSDLFVLYRDRPQVFTNRHASDSLQAGVRRREPVAGPVTVYWGLEGLREAVDSNNLGRHSRARGAAYGAIDWRALRIFSFNAGLRQEVYGALSSQLSPTFSVGVWLNERWKLRGNVSRAFRMPTYTDLYYHDPANVGSPDLRPERAWSYEAGADWNPAGKVRAAVTVFHRREENGIDYVRRSSADIWRATNIHRLRFTGLEAEVRTRWGADVSYTGLHGAQRALAGVQSRYVFNYPAHAAVAGWHGSWRGWAARTRVGVTQRRARDAYAVWDLYGARASGRVRPFIQFTNLADVRYEEVLGVVMPGRAVLGGFELRLF